MDRLERIDERATGQPSAPAMLLFRSWRRDTAGTTTILFVFSFTLIMFVTAMTVDYGRAELERVRMQRALDAAALAASHKLGLPDQDEAGREAAEAFYRMNGHKLHQTHLQTVQLNSATGEVNVATSGAVMSSLLNAVGIESLSVGASSRVVRGDGTLELALVLDNSGSMAGQPIEDLRTAALNLVGVVFSGATSNHRVSVGVVPFAGSVNIGSGNRGASWIDDDGGAEGSPLHNQNQLVAEKVSRFTLFDRLSTPWAGCVEARPAPYDTTDAIPTVQTPATLFVPMFAPDEPDSVNAAGSSYSNNYISDFGGSCPTPTQICTRYNSRRQRCEQWGPQPIDPVTAQGRTCKYQGATFSGSGPNAGCTTTPVLPLTDLKEDVDTALNAMAASGMTNIGEGVMWGWRVLSPEPPFTEGRSYSDPKNRKIVVLMTDGQNTYTSTSNQNKTGYGAFGYGVPLPAPLAMGATGRLGSTFTSSALNARMNEKTTAACGNAKDTGITIYTIAFRLESDPATLALLRNCASGDSKAFTASDGAALIQIFQLIGREISQLRVAG